MSDIISKIVKSQDRQINLLKEQITQLREIIDLKDQRIVVLNNYIEDLKKLIRESLNQTNEAIGIIKGK